MESADQDKSQSKKIEDSGQKKTGRLAMIKLVIPLGAALILFGAIAFGGAQYKNAKKYAFVIDGQKYTKDEIQKLTTYPRERLSMDVPDSFMLAYDLLAERRAAEKVGISFSQLELSRQALLIDHDIETYKDWTHLMAHRQLLQPRLANPASATQVRGYTFIFYFGQRQEKGPAFIPENYGNQELIAQDRAYAESRAKELYEEFKSGIINEEELRRTIQADPKITYLNSYQNGQGYTYSTSFSSYTDLSWEQKVFYPDVVNFIKTAPEGLSDIRIGKTGTGEVFEDEARTNAATAETFFYFVNMHQAHNGKSVQELFDTTKRDVRTKYYGS